MKIAIVRIRGRRNLKPKIKKTLELLRVNRTNHCVLVEDTPQMKGMIEVCKDYIAYGPVSEETVFRLLRKRGEKGKYRLKDVMEEEELKVAAKKILHQEPTSVFADPVFRLHPPRKGYKSIKHTYPRGDLGKREDMDVLLKRMM